MTQWGLDNLFNPGKRHMDDEKRRLQSTREEIGDSSGGRRIDLERGTVSISVPRPTAADATPDDDAVPDDDATAALDPAVEAADEPALALAGDETELEPEVVDAEDEQGADAPAAELDGTEPAAEPAAPAEVPPPAPRRRTASAQAWARRG